MSIYAFADIKDRRVRKIHASARYPSMQEGNVFFDSEHPINLKHADETPLRLEGFFALVAFRAGHILLSRDVIGGKPLYYSFNLTFSSFKSYFDEPPLELMPGEILKLGYDGNIISRKIYNFDDIFPKDIGKDFEQLLKEIERSLTSFNPSFSCLAFSGGVDSSLLASLYDVPLLSVTASQQEKEWVKRAAKMLGRKVDVFVFNEEDVKEALPYIISAIETCSAMQVSIAIPVYFTLKFAKELGYNSVVFGQGADELFGGYKRYEMMDAVKLEEELEKDVRNLGKSNLVRDTKLAYSLEMKILTPYLQWDVVRAAMNIPAKLKVKGVGGLKIRKFALRLLATKYIPKELAYRDKKAVQYSTKASSILMKMAKQEGMEVREYLREIMKKN
jgi:asparagine synthase (glutamine-hydrolysing)